MGAMAGMLGRADVDAGRLISDTVAMRRGYPLLLILAFVMLLAGGIIWKFIGAKECVDAGGIVLAPMTRGQNCAAE